MKNRIKFQENKIENYLSWARHYFNKYMGPIIGVALFSFLTHDNYNLRQEINKLRANEFWESVNALKMTSHKIRQLDEINEEKIKLIVKFNTGKIDSLDYFQQMDSLKALEDSLYKEESCE